MQMNMDQEPRMSTRLRMLQQMRERVRFILRVSDSDLVEVLIAALTFIFATKLDQFQNVPSFSVIAAARRAGLGDDWLQTIWWATAGFVVMMLFSENIIIRRGVMIWTSILWTAVGLMLAFYPQNSAYDGFAGVIAAFCWIVVYRLFQRRTPWQRRLDDLLHEMEERNHGLA